MTTANSDRIKRIIAALLAKAQSTNSEHESESCMLKVDELLEANNLELWQVRQVDDVRIADPIAKQIMFEYVGATPSMNDHLLLTAIASFYGCQVVKENGQKLHNQRWQTYVKYAVFGPESARVTTELMLPFVMSQCKAAGKRMEAQGYGKASKMQLQVVNALLTRIYRLIQDKAQAEQAKVAGLQQRALVIRDEIEDLVATTYGKLTKRAARALSTSYAARQEADKVSLHRQVASGGGVKLLGCG